MVLEKKLVVVGDGCCGKTSLLIAFKKGELSMEYEPTVFENSKTEMVVNGKKVLLSLWDTAGQEEYARLRPLSYPGTHVILVCFSVDSRDSLTNVKCNWIPEIRHHCKGVPYILVGNKTDLRSDLKTEEELKQMGQSFVTKEEGKAMAKEIKARAYVECSALKNDGVVNVFQIAVKTSLSFKKRIKVRHCTLL